MENKTVISNSEELTQLIASVSLKAVVSNDYWQLFGYKKKPRRGSMFRKFIDKNELMKEDFLIREFFISSLSTAIISLPNAYPIAFKYKLAARVLEKVLFMPDVVGAFLFNSVNDALIYMGHNIADYLNGEPDSMSTIFTNHAMEILGEQIPPVFLLGSVQLFMDGYFNIKVFIKNDLKHPITDNIVMGDDNILSYIIN